MHTKQLCNFITLLLLSVLAMSMNCFFTTSACVS